MAETEEELKDLLMKVKVESEKVGLKLNVQKSKIMASGPVTSWQINGETMETVRDFSFGGSKITADGNCSHEIKRCLLLGRKSAYLRLLIFLLAILIPACASSSPAFLMMYSAYKLNKQGENIHLDILLFLYGTSQLFHVQF